MSLISGTRMMTSNVQKEEATNQPAMPENPTNTIDSLSELHISTLMMHAETNSPYNEEILAGTTGLKDDQEITEIREAFLLFDKDNDGSISMKELSGVLTCLGYGHSKKDIKNIMKKYDTDNNGCIDFGEFVNMLRGSFNSNENETDEVRRALRVFDPDKDGLIHVDDLKYALTSMGEKLSDEEFEDFIKKVKVSNNGMMETQDLLEALV